MTGNGDKFAICFFGLTRSLKYTIGGIRKNIYDVLRDAGIEYDVYVHTYDLEHLTLRRSNEDCDLDWREYRLLEPDEVRVTSQEEFRDNFDWGPIKKWGDMWNTKWENLHNVFYQLNSLVEVTKMWRGKDTQKRYLQFRPDLLQPEPISLSYVNDPRLDTGGFICTPAWQRWWDGQNDRFAYGNRDVMEKQGLRIVHALAFCKSLNRAFHSELFLRWVLEIQGVKSIFIPEVAQRVRATGVIVDESFGHRDITQNPQKLMDEWMVAVGLSG